MDSSDQPSSTNIVKMSANTAFKMCSSTSTIKKFRVKYQY